MWECPTRMSPIRKSRYFTLLCLAYAFIVGICDYVVKCTYGANGCSALVSVPFSIRIQNELECLYW